MARGAESKEKIITEILKTFPGSFKYDKEIRIPMNEGGEVIQIKVTLTAAKTNVENGGDTAVPGEASGAAVAGTKPVSPSFMNAPTEEEKKAVEDLVSKLGLA